MFQLRNLSMTKRMMSNILIRKFKKMLKWQLNALRLITLTLRPKLLPVYLVIQLGATRWKRSFRVVSEYSE